MIKQFIKKIFFYTFVVICQLSFAQSYQNELHLNSDAVCNHKAENCAKTGALNNTFNFKKISQVILNLEERLITEKANYTNVITPFDKAFDIAYKQARNEIVEVALGIPKIDEAKVEELYKELVENAFSKLHQYHSINSLAKHEDYLNTQYKLGSGYYPVPQAACTNIDFANGTTSGWQCSWGIGSINQINQQVGITGNCPFGKSYDSNLDKCCTAIFGGNCTTPTGYSPVMANVNNPALNLTANTGIINTPANGATPGVHSIMTGGTDPWCPIPVIPPSGGKSIRLGHSNVTAPNNYKAQRIRQTFQVSSANPSFVYQYAIVLENPSHDITDQPYFKIRMLDVNNNDITCASYDVNSSSAPSIGGFTQITTGGKIILYKSWSTVTVPLINYIGQNVTIEFTTSDCAQGGHFGYAYVQCLCSPFEITSSQPAICNGQTTTLTAPSGAATYSWTGPGIISGANTQTAVANLGGTYTVNMSTFYTFPQTPCLYSQTIAIPGGTTSASPNFTTNSVCSNAPTSFTNSTTGGAGTTYIWNYGDGTSTYTTVNMAIPVVHNYTSAGTYSVTLTADNGCPVAITKTIIVNGMSIPILTLSNVCTGIVSNFTGAPTSSVGVNTHTWSFGQGSASSNLQNPSYTYTTPGNYIVSYTVSNGVDCPGTVTNTITIYPKPTISFSAKPVCLNIASTFTNSSSILAPDNINIWAWDFDNNTVVDDNAQHPTYTFTSIGSHTVELKAKSINGCSDSALASIVVNPLPVPSFSLLPACINSSITIVNSSSVSALSTLTLTNWSFGIGASSLTSTANTPLGLSYNTSGIKNITLDLTTSNGCTATATQSIVVFINPIASFSASSVCQNTVTAFTDLSTASGTTTISNSGLMGW